MNWHWLFHSWGKWDDPTEGRSYFAWEKPEDGSIVYIQQRACSICNQIDVRVLDPRR